MSLTYNKTQQKHELRKISFGYQNSSNSCHIFGSIKRILHVEFYINKSIMRTLDAPNAIIIG